MARDAKCKACAPSAPFCNNLPRLYGAFTSPRSEARVYQSIAALVFRGTPAAPFSFSKPRPNAALACPASADRVQKEAHTWGEANCVAFEKDKEGKYRICLRYPQGGFKYLGVAIDGALTMTSEISRCAGKGLS